MTRFVTFLVLLAVGVYHSDCASLPKASENGEATGSEFDGMTKRTFDYLQNLLTDKLVEKLFPQPMNSASPVQTASTKPGNSAIADLVSQVFIDRVKNLLTNVTKDGFRASEEDSKFFDQWFDLILGLFPSNEIPHDPVGDDIQNSTANSSESDPSLGTSKI